tara:strand:- start:5685 stop:6602 length:918 start_codon:yes stop_codon:yes gene_type:complete
LDKIKKPSLLVLGGTGFIGYHLMIKAKKYGWQITSLSKHKPKKYRYIKGVNYLTVDINNLNILKKKIKKSFDYVVNSGGYGSHFPFHKGGKNIFETHFFGMLNIIKVIKRKKLKKFIQIGTSEEYGKISAPQKENLVDVPNTPYAIAKLSCTEFLKILYKKEKFPFVVLRLFLVYGPKQENNRILPQIIRGCLKNKKFKTSSGFQKRDFCYIDDVIKAVFLSLKSKKATGKVFNIGTGKPLKVKNVVKTICKLVGKGKPQFGKIKLRKNENMSLYPSVKEAKKVLKWKAKVKFFKGINYTINSYK